MARSDIVSRLRLVLRIGALCCFVGHGAFGLLGKEAWLPYFAVAGIGPDLGHRLQPLIGTFDIAMGLLMFAQPRLAIGYWMVGWAVWTAMLRPLAGEPVWEMFERGGNYGVPAALVVMLALPATVGDVFAPARWRTLDDRVLARLQHVLTFCVVCLLAGHGALGVIGKQGLVTNYASVMPLGVAARITPIIGWIEIAAAAVIAIRPIPAMLIGVAVWKLATELLFVAAGARVWEIVERGGSYTGPIALALVIVLRRTDDNTAAA